MGWTIQKLGDGYHRILGATYACFLVILDDVAAAEHDPLLGAFGHRTLGSQVEDREVAQWLLAHFANLKEVEMSDLEGYDELVEQLKKIATPEQLLRGMDLEKRLAGLKPEERLAGLKPEERRAGMTADETILLLDDQVLRRLPDELIDSLPAVIRAEVRRRIGAHDEDA